MIHEEMISAVKLLRREFAELNRLSCSRHDLRAKEILLHLGGIACRIDEASLR